MIKLWERCEVAKIAMKRGPYFIDSELVSEELKVGRCNCTLHFIFSSTPFCGKTVVGDVVDLVKCLWLNNFGDIMCLSVFHQIEVVRILDITHANQCGVMKGQTVKDCLAWTFE